MTTLKDQLFRPGAVLLQNTGQAVYSFFASPKAFAAFPFIFYKRRNGRYPYQFAYQINNIGPAFIFYP